MEVVVLGIKATAGVQCGEGLECMGFYGFGPEDLFIVGANTWHSLCRLTQALKNGMQRATRAVLKLYRMLWE